MKPQIWFCEKCGALGATIYLPNAGAWSVYSAIKEDHNKFMPKCQDISLSIHLRILNIPAITKSQVLGMLQNKNRKMTKNKARVITAAREIRDYLMGLVLPSWPVPPGNLEKLDIALDDLDGVPMEKRVPLEKLEEYRENVLGQKIESNREY